MNQYLIMSESTCDLNQEIIDAHNILVIPMTIDLDGELFEHYTDFRNMSAQAFFEYLKQGKMATTSQITPMQYEMFWEPYLEKGYDILYVCFSSALSKTYESAQVARQMLSKKYPHRIHIVDSLSASAGEALLVYEAAMNREKGMTIEENVKYLEELKQHIHHYFTVDDLHFLKRGGRISAATALIGSALQIKPILTVNQDGGLISIDKVRGRKSSMRYLADKIKTLAQPNSKVYITHAVCEEDALNLKESLSEFETVMISDCGPIIGAHTGPNLLCVALISRDKRLK